MKNKDKIEEMTEDAEETLMTLEELLIKCTAMGEGEGYRWPRLSEEIAKTALKKASDRGRFKFEGISYRIETLTYRKTGYAFTKIFSYQEYLKMGKPLNLKLQRRSTYIPVQDQD